MDDAHSFLSEVDIEIAKSGGGEIAFTELVTRYNEHSDQLRGYAERLGYLVDVDFISDDFLMIRLSPAE